MSDVLYRADAVVVGDDNVKVLCMSYKIVKRTRCGVWIEFYAGSKRKFVNMQKHKKWACETEAEALESLKRRRERYLAILEDRIERTRIELDALRAGAMPGNTWPIGAPWRLRFP